MIFLKKIENLKKRLCLDMSSTERNKVKSFGDPSVDHGEMAEQFLVVGAIMAPLFQIELKLFYWYIFNRNSHFY